MMQRVHVNLVLHVKVKGQASLHVLWIKLTLLLKPVTNLQKLHKDIPGVTKRKIMKAEGLGLL